MKKTFWMLIGLLAIAAIPASANYLLLAPTGTTLTTGQVRAEAALNPSGNNGEYYWLGAGLMKVEANVIRRQPNSGDAQDQLGVQWNFLPETSFTPAIGFGLTDITGESHDGRGYYVAITKRLPVDRFSTFFKDLSVTAGLGAAGIKGPFGGFEAHLPGGLFVQGEYDSRDFNGAIGWQPVSLFRVKAYSLRDDFFFGAEIVPIEF